MDSRTQHPAYLLLRVEAIPLSLVLSTVINRIPHSGLTIWSTILACSSLLLAIHPSLQQITEEIVLLGLPASFLTALFPVLLLNKFHSVYDSLRPQHYARELDSESKPAHPIFHRDGLLVFWSVLRLIAVISLVEIAIVLLLSGELQDIHSNCYVLGLKFIWLLMASTGAISGVLLILTLWLVRTASPATTLFLLVPSSGHQVLITNHFRPPIHVWVDIVMCWGSSLYFFLIKAKESMSKAMNSKQKLSNILYHLIFPVVLYMGILYVARVSQAGRAGVSVEHGNATHNQDVDWYNSTESAFKPTDDYLGPRPHVDMVANLTMMVDKCKEVKNGRGVDDVVRCLSYLANSEQEYLSLPVSNQNMRASEQDPRKAQYLDADRHGNTRSRYIPPSRAQAASRLSIGTCAGPVIPFHVYWTGPATWRVELYIKAYLYTQNLPCSRLWLWLDADVDPDAVEKMLHQDRIFERFRPLVERGDITVKAWKYPNRVPIPTMKEEEESESNDFDQEEKLISKGIVQDADGQKWLVFDSSNLALSPVVVSDAVRFVVLHQYGGLYTDMDVLLRRDMRPMIVPDPATGERAFAEQWVERCEPGDFNTAVISLPANSSLSTYLLNGGLRMGLNFHPRVLGRMLFQDGRGDELAMQQNAVFDPLVTNRRREGTSKCTVPCHKNFESVFLRQVEEAQNEWSNFHGNRSDVPSAARSDIEAWAHPTNRSMENFFRGSWAYHIHNQVSFEFLFGVPMADLISSGPQSRNLSRGWTLSRPLRTTSSPVGAPTCTARRGLAL